MTKTGLQLLAELWQKQLDKKLTSTPPVDPPPMSHLVMDNGPDLELQVTDLDTLRQVC